MGKRIVIALGGNALGKNHPEQQEAVRETAKAIVDLVADGHDVIIVHGNGPQVGMINNAMTTLSKEDPQHPVAPMSVCTAMSQGYIGCDLQNAIREELLDRQIQKPVATVLTQVEVDADDPAFRNPTKPIGTFLNREEAQKMEADGHDVMEDAGRGWRRCVASPHPKAIVELDSIRLLADSGHVVIACGGGGVPVYRKDGNRLHGAGAVIDKDLAAELLAEKLDADSLIILTAVEKVAIHFGTPQQQWLDHMTPAEARRYEEEGHFAPGSMLPKVQAAVRFAESRPGRTALITLLNKAQEAVAGKTGTTVST